MWKPGQLVTICGEVYRIKRGEPLYLCEQCSFCLQYDCLLSIYEPKYRNCGRLIPTDCYFERLEPKCL